MNLLIKNARIIDPASGTDTYGDILCENGLIKAVGQGLAADNVKIVDAAGLCALPGFVDIHVHFRDPGFTHKEDILTGAQAAAAGGVTSVCCMPNTNPVIDSPETVEYIVQKAGGAKARVYPYAAVTVGQKGAELTDFDALKAAGAVAFSDDGRPVQNGRFVREAMKRAAGLGALIASHCEDLDIIDGGIMNAGRVSDELGVKGMDRTSEDSATARETAIAAADGTALHICHVSTKGSVAVIRAAKALGVAVTCETAPHYLLLTDELLRERDANFRMNPPLRTCEDVAAMIQAVRDGTVDALVTDHAPHSPEEKADFEKAPNGIIGLETSFAAAYTALVKPGHISLSRLAELMSTSPAKLVGLPAGTLAVGAAADIALVDEKEEWIFTEDDIASRSKNTPFIGTRFTGRVKMTVLGGEVVFQSK